MVYSKIQSVSQNYYVAIGTSVVTTGGSVTTAYASTWNGTRGTSGWATMDGGITTSYSRGMRAYSSTRVYLFGVFSNIGSATNLAPGYNFNLAEWDGTKWNYVGTPGTTNGIVEDVAYDSTNNLLYVVGAFTQIYGTSANRVAVYNYNLGTWSAMGTGATATAYSCELDGDNNLYICGVFGSVNSVSNTIRLARYDVNLSTWESIGSVIGTANIVRYDATNDIMYMGGGITSVNSISNTRLLARYDVGLGTWESVGSFNDASDSTIYSIVIKGDVVYIGGNFVSNGTDMAKLNTNTSTWTDLNDGVTYTVTPSAVMQPVALNVDVNNNIVVERNSGGMYILRSGTTTWQRLDNLSSDLFVPGITVSKTTATVTESGSTDTFGVYLDMIPDDTIVLDVSSADTSEVTASPAQLTFTTSNWDTTQTVTVTGVADNTVDANTETVITVSVNTGASTGVNYDAVSSKTVTVTNTNIDVTGGIQSSLSTLSVSEDGSAQTFTVNLSVSPPSGSVVLNVVSSNTSAVTVSPSTLTFTAANYDTPQTVTVTPVVSSATLTGPFSVTVSVNEALSIDSYVDTTDLVVTINWTEQVVAEEIVNNNALCFLDPDKCKIRLLNGFMKSLSHLKPDRDRVKTLANNGNGALVKQMQWRDYRGCIAILPPNVLGYSHQLLRLTADHIVMVRCGAVKFMPAKDVPNALILETRRVYRVVHVELENYELICVNGAWAESAETSKISTKGRVEILTRWLQTKTKHVAPQTKKRIKPKQAICRNKRLP